MTHIQDTSEEVSYTWFDTPSFEEGETGARNYCRAFATADRLGNLELTNMYVPGQLAGDATFEAHNVLFGGPLGTLKEWAKVQWEVNVGHKAQLAGALWMPPDTVEHGYPPIPLPAPGTSRGRIAARTEAEVAGAPVFLKTPADWEFLCFTPQKPIYVAARQGFEVRLTCLSGTPPTGPIRVLLRGIVRRDIF